ncbi:hypothetical protein [Corallococcus sp. EGB]|uniref:hypothetical protein n=1 Tax=Corallococcus sp. EGB TaxID=1521117 RepID=UPI001CBB1F54|nr:hypothetical protein [Corallococcus sp. EGB]
MKLPLMAAIAALSLYGCASHNANTREASSPEAGAVGGSGSAGSTQDSSSVDASASDASNPEHELPGETANVPALEKRDRMNAPTVYEGEATGGSGAPDETVKTKDGQKWDVQPNTPTDLGDSQTPSGAVNQNRDPNEKGNLGGTGGSGSTNTSGKSDVSDETGSGALNSDADSSSNDTSTTQSKVETDATPDPTN